MWITPAQREALSGTFSQADESGDRRPPLETFALAAAKGDRAAAQELLRQLLPRVRHLVRYLVRHDTDVDDLAQESMVALLKGLSSYRADGSFAAWADRVVARVVFKNVRKRARARRETIAEGGEAVAAAFDRSSLPDEIVALRRAVTLLDHLTIDQRQALVLHDVLEMTIPEIARELGAPFETVRSRIKSARARFVSLAHERTRKEDV